MKNKTKQKLLSYLHPSLSHEEAIAADRRLTLCSGGGCGLWWTSHSLRPPPMDHGIINLAWSKLAVMGREERGTAVTDLRFDWRMDGGDILLRLLYLFFQSAGPQPNGSR